MISVLIPAYNRENTIQNSICSVLSQTIQDFEIIIIDDCSSDHTKERVLELKDERIHYYRLNKNCGAGGARNEGIRYAKGNYIAFHDSDDVMHTDKLESELRFLEANNYDVVYSQLERFDINGKSLGIEPKNCHNCYSLEETYRYFLWEGRIWTQTMFAKRECFEYFLFDGTMKCNEDWEISLRLAKQYKIGFLARPLTDVYIQSNSISTDEGKALESYLYLQNKYYEDICVDREMQLHWEDRILFTKWCMNQLGCLDCIKGAIKIKDAKWIIRGLLGKKNFYKLKNFLKR